ADQCLVSSYLPKDGITGKPPSVIVELTSPAYKVLHNGEMSEIIVTEQPARIGILLDYNTGRLLFLNAERGQLLSAIKYKFTKAAYPAFVLEQSGFLNLHTGMELPEFAKQS
ncbi:hypothetical protein E2320_017664, partial [Naja naja]